MRDIPGEEYDLLEADLDEMLWQEYERNRRRRDNELCGYYEEEGEDDGQG